MDEVLLLLLLLWHQVLSYISFKTSATKSGFYNTQSHTLSPASWVICMFYRTWHKTSAWPQITEHQRPWWSPQWDQSVLEQLFFELQESWLPSQTLPCCPIHSALHPAPPRFAAVMTQFPLWHARPSGINKVNLMSPCLIFPWIAASLLLAGTFATCGDEVKMGSWPKRKGTALCVKGFSWWQQRKYVLINLHLRLVGVSVSHLCPLLEPL